MRLWILTFIMAAGLMVSCWTLLQTLRTCRALVRSGKNGVRWALVTGDLVDDTLRIIANGCVAGLLVRSLLLVRTPQPEWNWRTWVFVAAFLALAFSSVNRWLTTRALTAQLNHGHDREQEPC